MNPQDIATDFGLVLAAAVAFLANWKRRKRPSSAANVRQRVQNREATVRKIQDWSIDLSDWGYRQRLKQSAARGTNSFWEMDPMPEPPSDVVQHVLKGLTPVQDDEVSTNA